MVSTVYFFLCQLLQFSFKNCFVPENLRQAGRYVTSKSVKKSVPRGVRVLCASLPSLALCFQPLTARAYLNTQKYGLFCSLGTLYITRALLTLLIFLEASN